MSQMSKMSCAVAVAAFGLVLLNGVNFVAPNVPKSLMPQTFSQSETAPMPSAETSVPAYGTAGMALMATAAVGLLAAGAQRMKVARKATHGIKFSYSIQKDAYADLEFMNDVGYLPGGTPMNRAGNAINHPETIGPDPHTPGSPLPRAEFVNSIGYLPDGTPMNAAENALNHPETMQPDMHNPGSPLPASFYAAEVGYLVDGTPMATAGNLSVQAPPVASTPASMPAAPPTPPPSAPTSVAAGFTSTATEAVHGIKFSYSMQKDAYADYEFINDVGYLPDGTPMNRAGNAINHPETIGPDPHTPGSPLPRAIFVNSVGYLPDGTPLNAAGNALNHPETMQPDSHAPGSPLPRSYYAAEVGYLVDGTDLVTAGNLSVQGVPAAAPAAAPAAVQQPVAAAFVGASAGMGSAGADKRVPAGFAYAVQKDAYADLTYGNDVGYLPDGTPMNTAGNCINHPETIGPDPHSPGSPLPRAIFVNDVGYLPDGTPMNRAGNAINHPETIGPDPHTPGSELPPSVYAADIGYLVDGTPLDAAGNNAVH